LGIHPDFHIAPVTMRRSQGPPFMECYRLTCRADNRT
jgi:hypothetical protein